MRETKREPANFSSPQGEDRMLNERKRIESILGEGQPVGNFQAYLNFTYFLERVLHTQISFKLNTLLPSPSMGEGGQSSDEGGYKIILTLFPLTRISKLTLFANKFSPLTLGERAEGCKLLITFQVFLSVYLNL